MFIEITWTSSNVFTTKLDHILNYNFIYKVYTNKRSLTCRLLGSFIANAFCFIFNSYCSSIYFLLNEGLFVQFGQIFVTQEQIYQTQSFCDRTNLLAKLISMGLRSALIRQKKFYNVFASLQFYKSWTQCHNWNVQMGMLSIWICWMKTSSRNWLKFLLINFKTAVSCDFGGDKTVLQLTNLSLNETGCCMDIFQRRVKTSAGRMAASISRLTPCMGIKFIARHHKTSTTSETKYKTKQNFYTVIQHLFETS